MAVIHDETSLNAAILSLNCPERTYPSVGQYHPPALRLERTINDLFGLKAEGLPDTRHWVDHDCWGVRARWEITPSHSRTQGSIAFCPCKGWTASDRSRPGTCRHY